MGENIKTPYFDNALICKNGHIINTTANLHPEKNEQFCSVCGEKVINECDECGTKIKGSYVNEEGKFFPRKYFRPNCCHNCGKAHPWVMSNISAILELLKINGGFSDAQLENIELNLLEMVKETPKMHLISIKLTKNFSNLDINIKQKVKKIINEIFSEKVLENFRF